MHGWSTSDRLTVPQRPSGAVRAGARPGQLARSDAHHPPGVFRASRLRATAAPCLRTLVRAGAAQRPQEETYTRELRALVAREGLHQRAQFLGQRDDVPHLLSVADIHCQPNLGPEPFGIVFIEALYAGLPVVAAAAGGPLEIVDDTCGILVPPGDAAALAAALRLLVEDSETRRRLGAASFRRALALCDPARQLPRLHEVLAGSRVPA